jgi:catechol 2,3-dioxygenase-like lactoylglutathione lyase family enzyme
MSARPLINEVGHASIRTRDLDAVEEVATQVMGLRVSERSADAIWLTCDHHHHSLHYVKGEVDALEHLGLRAPDGDAVAEVRERVVAAGFEIVRDGPEGPAVSDGFAFSGPEGAVFEIYSEMDRIEPDPGQQRLGVPPNRLGHANFFAEDPAAMQKMLTEILDFRISDYAGEGQFLRCNPDHHGVGVFPGPGHLHHIAWEVSTAIELGQLADLIDQRGGAVIWGPLRHGIGRNIATYFQDPSGLVIEYYADMEQIFDDEHHQPTHWDLDDPSNKWISLWGPHLTPENFVEMGVPFAVAAGASSRS